MSDLEKSVAPCPFCGYEPVSMDGVTRFWACVKHTFWMSAEEWNRRAPWKESNITEKPAGFVRKEYLS